MASALQPEIWRPNIPGVRELITYSTVSKPETQRPTQQCTIMMYIYYTCACDLLMKDSIINIELVFASPYTVATASIYTSEGSPLLVFNITVSRFRSQLTCCKDDVKL